MARFSVCSRWLQGVVELGIEASGISALLATQERLGGAAASGRGGGSLSLLEAAAGAP